MISHISSPARTLFDLTPLAPHIHPLLAEFKKTVRLVDFSHSFTFFIQQLALSGIFSLRNHDQPNLLSCLHSARSNASNPSHILPLLAECSKNSACVLFLKRVFYSTNHMIMYFLDLVTVIGHITFPAFTLCDLTPPTPNVHPLLAEFIKKQ